MVSKFSFKKIFQTVSIVTTSTIKVKNIRLFSEMNYINHYICDLKGLAGENRILFNVP